MNIAKRRWHFCSLLLGSILACAAASPASAADGCTVMLCLAGNWKNISPCVPPVRDALRDLLLGHPLPHCATVSADTGAVSDVSNQTLDVASCPPQYLLFSQDADGNPSKLCTMTGAVSVVVDGQVWSRTYWNSSDDLVTWYSTSARAQLGPVDDRYDRDVDAWRASPTYAQWDCLVNGNCPQTNPPSNGGEG